MSIPSTRAVVGALRGESRVILGSRRDSIRITFVAPTDQLDIRDHRLVFAIGRNVGGAVRRNRCRRRLREAFAEVRRRRTVPIGAYLLRPSASAIDLPYGSLLDEIDRSIETLDRRLQEASPA